MVSDRTVQVKQRFARRRTAKGAAAPPEPTPTPTPEQGCQAGLTLAPGESCAQQDITFQVASSGTLLVRFTGDRVDSSAPTLTRSGNRWRIE